MAAVSLLLLACLNPQEALAQDQWVQAGPAGASVATLVVDPSNPSIVYAGLFDQGVYRTADAGAHWTAVNSGLTNLVIRRLAIDPVTPSILYVVTNDGIVYRTTNAGGTWNLANGGLPPPPPQPYTENDPISLAVDPVTPSRLYFSTGPGIYRSTNSGQTWERHDTGLPAGKDGLVYSFAINPIAPSTLYAGGRGRVFRSTNAGDSWIQISDTTLHQNAGRQALAIDPIVPTTLYYSGNEVSSGGVWRSLDGGVTWSHRIGGPIGSLAVDPVTHSTVYAGTFFAGVWKSTDSGGTWVRADTGMYPRGQINALGISPLLPARVYAGSQTGAGIFRTDDAAATWAPANADLFAIGIGSLTVHPATPSKVFAMVGGGVMRSGDMGRSWTVDPMPPGYLAVDPSTPATMYSATESGVFRTTDGGTTWAWVLNVTGTRAIAIDPAAPSTVYAASGELAIFKSTDGGDTWTNMSAGLPATSASWMQIVVDPVQPSTVYLSAWRIYKTVNGGVSWTEASDGLPAFGLAVTALAIDPLDPSKLYAATSLGVFRTANGGGVWDAVSALPSTWAWAVAIDPMTPANVYAAYGASGSVPEPGIFRSMNGGTSWSAMNDGLTDTSVIALAIDPFTPSILYAGTASRSSFRWQPDGLRRLAVTKPGTGAGTVTASAGSLQCGADCVEEYAIGTVVTLSAVAQSPSTFSGFGGEADCVDGSVTLTDNRTCSAIFSLPRYSLTVTVAGAGTGSVTSSPPGISCGSDCQELYDHGMVVTLTAAPAPGWVFGAWGGACAGSALTCQVTVNQARTVTARFDPTPPAPFAKLGPADGATGLPWVNGLLVATLSWQLALRATSYEYCFDTINNGACDTAWVTAPLTQGAVTSQLAAATTYFWQARAVNSAGSTLANGGWWSFRTTDGSPPGDFAKIGPSPGAVVHPARVTLSWQPSLGAMSYEFCAVPIQTFNCLPVWTSTPGTSAVITGLWSSTQYVWRVRARNAHGTTESQVTWGFTTAAAGEDLALDLGASLGLWVMSGAGAWQHVHGLSPESMLRADLDGNGADDLVIDFGPQLGVWVWMNHASWRHLHGLSPTQMVAGDFDGNGQDDLVLDFPGLGLWRFSNNAAWTHLHGSSAARLAVGNLDGAGGQELLVSFTNGGLWICSGTGVWSLVHGSNVIALLATDLDGNGQDDIVVSFAGGLGLWTRQNQILWSQLHGLAPAQVLAARLDANSQADLVVDFGSGMGVWTLRNRTAWALLQGAPVEGIETLDRDGDGLDDIVIDLGPAIGLWQYSDDGVWSLIHGLSPEVLAAGRLR